MWGTLETVFTPGTALIAQLALLGMLFFEWRRRRAMHQVLSRHVFLQQVLSNTAIRFLRIPHELVEVQIESALKEIGECLGMSRIAIWVRHDDLVNYRLAHWWAHDGSGAPQLSELPAPLSAAQRGNPRCSYCLTAENEMQISMNIAGDSSSLVVPLPGIGASDGFVCLAPVPADAHWPAVMLPMLGLIAETIGIALDRCDSGRALRLSDELTNSLLAALSSVVAVVDRKGIIVRVSEGWRRQAHESAGTVHGFVGWSYLNVCARAAAAGNPDAEQAREALRAVLAGEQTEFVLEYSDTRNDETRWWELHVHGLVHPQLGALIVHAETTARKRDVAQVVSSLHELAHAGRAITVGTLAGSLAHEISQPLTAIMSNAQAGLRMLKGATPDLDQIREILTDIVADDRRAGEVVHRTRALLKKKENPRLPLQLSELTHDAIRLVRDEALARKVQITLDLAPDLPMVTADPVQLQQVVVNLVLNAFDALEDVEPAERRLTVRTQAVLNGVELIVEDCGRGISAENLTRMFEPFVTTKKAGLGLGLHITRTIVEAHGGSISAEPLPTRGLRMRVLVPEQLAARAVRVPVAVVV